MKLFGKTRDDFANGPVLPVVVALMEGWGLDAAATSLALPGRTPAFDRLAKRSTLATLNAAQPTRGCATALATVAGGRTVAPIGSAVKDSITEAGGIAQTEGFQTFVRRLRHVGGDCHLISMMSPAGIEADTNLLSVLAATLSHEGIRVWVHAVLDGRDAPPDSSLAALSEFANDTAGAEHVQIATVVGRALAFDTSANRETLSQTLAAIVEADPQARDGLTAHIEQSITRGTTDAHVPAAANPAYPGLRGEDAVLIVHPRPDGFGALLSALVPDGGLTVPTSRPLTLSGLHKLVDWPQEAADGEDAEARAPLFTFERPTGLLPDAATQAGVEPLLLTPQQMTPVFAAYFEGKPEAESRAAAFADPVAVADTAVEAIKKGDRPLIVALLGGAPAAARGGDVSAAKRFVESQDKALGRIAAIIERRGGSLLVAGLDRGLSTTAEGVLPFLACGPALPGEQAAPASLADLAPTVLGLLGIAPGAQMTGTPLLSPGKSGSVHASAI